MLLTITFSSAIPLSVWMRYFRFRKWFWNGTWFGVWCRRRILAARELLGETSVILLLHCRRKLVEACVFRSLRYLKEAGAEFVGANDGNESTIVENLNRVSVKEEKRWVVTHLELSLPFWRIKPFFSHLHCNRPFQIINYSIR